MAIFSDALPVARFRLSAPVLRTSPAPARAYRLFAMLDQKQIDHLGGEPRGNRRAEDCERELGCDLTDNHRRFRRSFSYCLINFFWRTVRAYPQTEKSDIIAR